MPLLFFLSGLLVPRSLSKGAVKYFDGKLRKILHPYILWSLLIILVGWLATSALPWWNVPPLWDIVLSPVENLWFLAYLLVYYVVAYVARRVNPLWMVFGATALMSIPIDGDWGRLAQMAVPFFLGCAMVRYDEAFQAITGRIWLSVGLFVTATILTIGDRVGILNLPPLSWVLPVLLAFFVGAIGLMKPIGDSRILAPLRYVGERSIIFYILHWPIMMIVVPILVTNGNRDPWSLFYIALAVGLIPALLLTVLTDRSRLARWLFEWNPSAKPSSSPIETVKEVPTVHDDESGGIETRRDR